jgi:hypothetical protein
MPNLKFEKKKNNNHNQTSFLVPQNFKNWNHRFFDFCKKFKKPEPKVISKKIKYPPNTGKKTLCLGLVSTCCGTSLVRVLAVLNLLDTCLAFVLGSILILGWWYMAGIFRVSRRVLPQVSTSWYRTGIKLGPDLGHTGIWCQYSYQYW